MLAALLCNLPYGRRKGYIIGDLRHYLTRDELAEVLAEREEVAEVKLETPKGPAPVPKKQWKLIKSQVREIRQSKGAIKEVIDDDEDEIVLLLAYA